MKQYIINSALILSKDIKKLILEKEREINNKYVGKNIKYWADKFEDDKYTQIEKEGVISEVCFALSEHSSNCIEVYFYANGDEDCVDLDQVIEVEDDK